MARKFDIKNLRQNMSYRSKMIIIVVGSVLCLVSLLYTWHLAGQLRQKEDYEMRLWSLTMNLVEEYGIEEPLAEFRELGSTIPYIITDADLRPKAWNLISDKIISDPNLLYDKLYKLSEVNDPLERTVRVRERAWQTERIYVFYGNSSLHTSLSYFPIIQIVVIAVFVIFALITYRTSEQDEQNKVWIGLAKETAHQLGTPISSLLGWIEYLRSQPVDHTMVEEMDKDLTRLMKVADRFSKIGSETTLSPANVNEVVGGSVMYFRTRIPKNVTLTYNGFAMAPVEAMLNTALFEWVTENLLKNSLDALQGQGEIDVRLHEKGEWIYLDFSDTGKGIHKNNFKRIFEPGFTTKTRGWGLGLSLSRRIIEEYHRGRIFVENSELGKGTTIRIMLRRSI